MPCPLTEVVLVTQQGAEAEDLGTPRLAGDTSTIISESSLANIW